MKQAHPSHSETARLEAFSDGVFAIIMTIMVLELRAPHQMTAEALTPLAPVFLAYVLSFLNLAIYWNNHHHLLHATEVMTGGIMWANMHLLFWLSLIPFTTSWVGQSHGETSPAVAYGVVLFMAACAYSILKHAIIRHEGADATLARALGKDVKGKISVLLYACAIAGAFVSSWITYGIVILVALMWFIPDRRIAPMKIHRQADGRV